MKTTKKILSAVLAVVVLLCCMPLSVFAASDGGVTVSFALSGESADMPMQSITLSDGEAEKFGYTMPETDHNGEKIEEITVFDVIVAAHEAYYGDEFTKETAQNYLIVTDGQIKLAFGKKASASGFAVNNEAPHDDNFNELWSSYTGYGACEATVENGDFVSYFFYNDTYFYSDYYAWFECADESAVSLTAVKNDSVTLTVKGFCYGWYSCSKDEDKGIVPLPGMEVYLVKNGEYTSVGTTNENGQITVKFGDKGDFSLCAKGTTSDDYSDDIPVVNAWCSVKVLTRAQSNWQKIVNFFRTVFQKIANLFK